MSGPRFYCAPLEGLTSFVFRRAHARLYPGVDKYYSPFLAPSGPSLFSKRERRDVAPENNEGVVLVPQLLTRSAGDFIRAARELQAMGYREINLNLGCPSGTVTAKGKGAGFLKDPEQLDSFLESIFSKLRCRISIKTRLGMEEPEEFYHLLDIFNKYPVYELTLHPRVRGDFYKKPVRETFCAFALENSRAPVCLNGDIFNLSAICRITEKFPDAAAVMLGRGLCADPALVCRALGDCTPGRERLLEFHDEVFRGYTAAFGSANSALPRMKELWFYLINLFADSGRYAKLIRKSTDPAEYETLAHEVIMGLDMLPEVTAAL